MGLEKLGGTLVLKFTTDDKVSGFLKIPTLLQLICTWLVMLANLSQTVQKIWRMCHPNGIKLLLPKNIVTFVNFQQVKLQKTLVSSFLDSKNGLGEHYTTKE